jgi:transposase InsO family protein
MIECARPNGCASRSSHAVGGRLRSVARDRLPALASLPGRRLDGASRPSLGVQAPASTTVARALPGYLRWYNRHRPHSTPGGRPPISRVSQVCGSHT